MSSKGNTFESDLLTLIFNNTAIANIGDAGGLQPSATAGSLFVSLHTDDVGEAGSPTTNELTLGSYARATVARSGAGWTVSANNVSNTAQIRIPSSGSFSSGSETAQFFAISKVSTAGSNADLLYTGHLGNTPEAFTAEATTDILTVKNHSFVDDDPVFIFEIPGETLPTGLARGTYFVITPTADDFQVEATLGGGAVNFTTDGAGYIALITPRALTVGDAFTFEIGDLDIFED